MKLFSLFANRPPAKPKRSSRLPQVDPELSLEAASLLVSAKSEELSKRVSVAWHGRLTSTAGLARPDQAAVLLNPRLKAFPSEVDRTLRHELAHLLAFDRARGRRIAAHGTEWKRACADLGIPGESRCHTLPLPRRKVNGRHLYRCPRCGFLLQRVRPIKPRRRLACQACCENFARGRFDRRFEFVKIAVGGTAVSLRPRTSSFPLKLETLVQQTLNLLFQ